MIKPATVLIIIILTFTFFGYGTCASVEENHVPTPYLMMLTFFGNPITKNNLDHVRTKMAVVFNESAYDGIAVFPIDAYYSWDRTNFMWLAQTGIKKQIWPWIFFNRIAEDPKASPRNKPWFRGIRGLDLYNQTGALQDFYEILHHSLVASRKMNSPGIVIDAELYNNHDNHKISQITSRQGKTEAEIVSALRNIGSKMADMIHENHPNAIIWFLYAPLHQEKPWSTTEIVFGILDRAKEKNYTFKVVAGGGVDIGYCVRDHADLESKINSRALKFATYLEKYPNILKLGGTVGPWESLSSKKGWTIRGECGSSVLRNATDFEPIFKTLMRNYEYVWVYGDSGNNYNPFEKSTQFNAILTNVRQEVQISRGQQP
jgi:hypothetical protein